MINRLKRHIITVNMLLVGIVILMIMTAVCLNSYSRSVSELERGLERVTEINDDDKHKDDNREAASETVKLGKPDADNNHPMMISSYVYVEAESGGDIVTSSQNNLTIDSDDLEKCVKYVLESDKKSGQLSDYGLFYVKNDMFNTTRIAFASNSGIYSSLGNTILVCALLFGGSMVIVFLISLGLSSLAVKPVKKAWDQQKQFVADASHELKTPLTVILANNSIMMSHEGSTVKDERQWLESTEEEAQHMKKLIDQMLFLAQSDAGTAKVELSDVDFSEIAEAATLNFEPVAFEKEVIINADIDPEAVLRGSRLWLNQLTHILIDNAVKYAFQGTEVTVKLKKRDGSVVFSVNNRGSVIGEDELEKIFDRFYRAEKSRTTKGYGLGLSIAKRITEEMNGKLTAQSNEKDGTTFTAVFSERK